MSLTSRFASLVDKLPAKVRGTVDRYLEMIDLVREIKDPRVARSLGPSGLRGLVLRRGKQGTPTEFQASHRAYFDWTYPSDHPEMDELYRRAKRGQWDGETYLDWSISVDPHNHEVPILPDGYFDFSLLPRRIKLDRAQQLRFNHDAVTWMLSQFLHGEQGALMAAAQVTEAVQFFDGKYYGATQVVDEARHVEVFHRYLDTKLEKLYQVNDNLFVIIDALMEDSRWDMKFLGMQIMVEGLALGAFGTLYKITREPLLKSLLKMVIQDEARHVHYGVLALREHITKHLSDAERREREQWAFEVALLMRNRFMAYEVYEEWFEGQISREEWRKFILGAPGMEMFRHTMFSRLVPNLREIGLLSDKIKADYDRVGLMKYFDGLSADRLTPEILLGDLEPAASSASSAA